MHSEVFIDIAEKIKDWQNRSHKEFKAWKGDGIEHSFVGFLLYRR